MGYINVFVSKEANISIKNNQLTLKNKDKSMDYPLEDMNSLMIENMQTNLSAYALSKLAQYGIITFICDANHMPCGVVLPYCEHYQTLSCFQYQQNASKPLQKQLWKTLIKNKIANQNDVLNMCGGMDKLKKIYSSVLSGDSSNCEAKASVIYFKDMYGKDFRRRDVNIINAFLNYGYAIIRGFVARSICIHGLQPFLGINHKNQFNQFNLADDLMEIFRPLVDLFVKINLSEESEITPQIKAQLYNIINIEVLVDGQKHSASYAIDLFVQSFVKSIKEGKDKLKNVSIIGLNIHNYE